MASLSFRFFASVRSASLALVALLASSWPLVAAESAQSVSLEHYQEACAPMLLGVALAIGLTFLLKETGPAMARQS